MCVGMTYIYVYGIPPTPKSKGKNQGQTAENGQKQGGIMPCVGGWERFTV